MKKIFFAGLATLLPLTVTFWVFVFFLDLLTHPFMGFVTSLLTSFSSIGDHLSLKTIEVISEFLILIGLILLLFFLGVLARFFLMKSILKLGDRLLHKIPIINKIYQISKEIVHSIFGSESASFKQVVLVPFPYPKGFCLGLISNGSPKTCSEATQTELVSVFIPTTPNPTTGYILMCKRSDLILLDMTSQEAIKYIVSCAVIQPGEMKAVEITSGENKV